MLGAVLGRPIASLTVLNPGSLGELASDEQVVLDIRVELHDGSRVDVEMQVRAGPTSRTASPTTWPATTRRFTTTVTNHRDAQGGS